MGKKHVFWLAILIFVIATLKRKATASKNMAGQKVDEARQEMEQEACETQQAIKQKASEVKQNVQKKVGETLDSAGNKISEIGKYLKENSQNNTQVLDEKSDTTEQP